jgi:hypothetical protein
VKDKKEQNKKSPEKQKQPELTMEQKVWREIAAWFWVGLAFLLINGAVGQARVIPSESMQNTLLVGDHLIMSRVGYDAGIPFTNVHLPLWRNPKRGQIVIFRPVIPGETSDVIKRVMAACGSTERGCRNRTPSAAPSLAIRRCIALHLKAAQACCLIPSQKIATS